MAELKSCPFCGGEAEVVLIPNRFIDNEYIVCCSSISCAIRPKTNRFRCEKKAIEAWNTRKPMEEVVAELEVEKERYENDRTYWSEHPWKDSLMYNECDMNDRKVSCFEEAISIVRNGGKE